LFFLLKKNIQVFNPVETTHASNLAHSILTHSHHSDSHFQNLLKGSNSLGTFNFAFWNE